MSLPHAQYHLAGKSFRQYSPGASCKIERRPDPRKISFTENKLWESAPLVGLNDYAVKMSARGTWRPWALTLTNGKPLIRNVQLEGRHCNRAFPSLKRHLPNRLGQRDKRGKPGTRETSSVHHICSLCRRDCHSRIGLSSHTGRSSSTINQSAIP